MSSVTIEFFGICTHFEQQFHPELPARHRVVLVRSSGGVIVRDVSVPEHVAHLILPQNGTRIDLQGVTLSLELASAGAAMPPFVLDPTFQQVVPQLTRLVAEISPLSEPSAAVVMDRSPLEAYCYFDIDFGTLAAGGTEADAVFTSLVVQSIDSDIVLTATPFPGTSLPPGLAERTTLPDGAFVTVSNIDSHFHDKKAVDFLLHYRTAAHMPPIPQIPQMGIAGGAAMMQQRHRPFPIHTIGAGCSNSSYP